MLSELYDKTMELYEQVQAEVMTLRRVNDRMSPEELVDAGYLLREIESLLDDGRKECKARKAYIAKLLGREASTRALAGRDDLKIKGQLANATVDIKLLPKMPKAGTSEFDELMNFFGVTGEAARTGLLSLHFVKLTEYLTKSAEDGINPPPGLVGTFPEYSVIYRKKKR